MFYIDNETGLSTMPTVASKQSNVTKWFTEGDDVNPPSYPGQDWFNMVQAELLNILALTESKPEKGKHTQISDTIKALLNNLANDSLSKSKGGTISAKTNFTDTLRYKNNEVITFINSFGWGQSWQDVTASRNLNVTYTNTTGKPIMVNIMPDYENGNFTELLLSSNSFFIARGGRNLANNTPTTMSAIIPNLGTYTLSRSIGDTTFLSWFELR